MSRGPSKWALLGAILVVMFVADQWTKFLAVERLTYAFQRHGLTTTGEKIAGFYTLRHLEGAARTPYVVWKPMWRMTYAENPGAAWGLFRGLPEATRNLFFYAVSAGAVIFILWYYRKLRSDQRWLQVALAFVLSGALGNLADRIARGYVVDFVSWHWWNRPDLYWPTFNVADSLIVVGVAMMLVHPGDRKDAARGNGRLGSRVGR